MRAQQPLPQNALREKLRWSLLSPDQVRAALMGLSADTATQLLCPYLDEEQQQRTRRERRFLIGIALGLSSWFLLNRAWSLTETLWFSVLLIGPLLLAVALWLSARQPGPLRHNTLMGLAEVLPQVQERASLDALCGVAQHLNGRRRSWERELEEGVHATLAQLLMRLTPSEAQALSEPTRAFLRASLTPPPNPTLAVPALLVLGSAQDPQVRSLAQALLESATAELLREAAQECLKELQ